MKDLWQPLLYWKVSFGFFSKPLWKSQLIRWKLWEVWILPTKTLKKEKWSTITGHPVHFMEGAYIPCKLKSSGKRSMVENNKIHMLMKQEGWKLFNGHEKKCNLSHLSVIQNMKAVHCSVLNGNFLPLLYTLTINEKHHHLFFFFSDFCCVQRRIIKYIPTYSRETRRMKTI